jgi:hypothetical protein
MASPEIIRPQEDLPERSGSMGSQFHKYVASDIRVPKGKEWAFDLINKVPDKNKEIVTSFIAELPFEERQKGAQHLSELIDNMGDQIRMSRYPEVEIGKCIEETRRWLSVNKEKE